VLFSYDVKGRTFQSRRLTCRATRGLLFPDALGMLRGVTQGRDLSGYHDPLVPSRAVLIAGISFNNIAHLLLALAFLGFVSWKLLPF
jgi:hypothetical protein